MKGFIKSISSLIIAIFALLTIFLLPIYIIRSVKTQLDYIAKSENVAVELGYQFAQKSIAGSTVLAATVLISIAAHRVYKNRGSEEDA